MENILLYIYTVVIWTIAFFAIVVIRFDLKEWLKRNTNKLHNRD